jgi:hypothetical protein
MRVGNPNLRTNSLDPQDIASRAVTLRCFEGLSYGVGAPGYDPADTFSFPPSPCSGGIRSNIYFPQYVLRSRFVFARGLVLTPVIGVGMERTLIARTTRYGTYRASACDRGELILRSRATSPMRWAPSSAHNVPRPTPCTLRCFSWRSSGTLAHSTLQICGRRTVASRSYSVWEIRKLPVLPSTSIYPPLEFTRSDYLNNCHRTGFGQHADYVFGWEGDSLQRAVDVCTGGDGIPTNCPELTVQDMDSMNACKQPAYVPEVVEGQCKLYLPNITSLRANDELCLRHRTPSRMQP